jgi:hypothetical protein
MTVNDEIHPGFVCLRKLIVDEKIRKNFIRNYCLDKQNLAYEELKISWNATEADAKLICKMLKSI